MSPSPLLLIRKGRVLTPGSRTRYRWIRLRMGWAYYDGDGIGLVLRLVSLPVAIGLDYALWPLVRRTLGRGPWWVVEVRFTWEHDDAEFVRFAQASSEAEAHDLRRQMSGPT